MIITTIIFDLGGVLFRTEDRQPRAQTAARLGLTYEALDEIIYDGPSARQAGVGKITASQHWENVCQILNWPLERLSELQEGFWGGDRLDWELVAWIRSLRRRYHTGLLSNAWDDLRGWLEQRWFIADAFDTIIISAEVKLAKPDPRIFQLTMERMQTTPEATIFIDDSEENITAARDFGLHAIQFQNPDQARRELLELLS